jgi:hypothetical protein
MRMMKSYEVVILYQSIRFTFDGQRVTGADTAASLGLEEGDTIEVFQVLSIIMFYFILFYSMFMYIVHITVHVLARVHIACCRFVDVCSH